MSLNKVMLIGNVGGEPSVRYLEGNAKVASFTLATTERYKDRNGETRDNTEWHNIVAWRATADVVEKFVHKGTQLYVEGRLRTRNYTDQQGNKKYVTEITADTIQLLGRKSDNESYQAAPQPAPAPQQPAKPSYQPPVSTAPAPEPQGFDGGDGTDDLPF